MFRIHAQRLFSIPETLRDRSFDKLARLRLLRSLRRGWALLLAGAFWISPAAAAGSQRIDLVLNWVPAGDFAPYYYASKLGWYENAGIDLRLEFGKGSSFVAQKVGAGINPAGVADMATALVAIGRGADLVAVYNIYANSAHGFYWLKDTGITGPQDFPGKRIGAPAADGVRVMWPAFAKATGIPPESVTWVNIDPGAKLAALQGRAVDIVPSFYNRHYLFRRELGERMQFLAWRDTGVNPYGNSIIVHGAFLRANTPLIENFVRVTQRAFLACARAPEPCVRTLVDAHPALRLDDELANWKLVVEVMRDPQDSGIGPGAHDAARLRSDYELIRDFIGIDRPYDVSKIYTNEFLDRSLRMPEPADPGKR